MSIRTAIVTVDHGIRGGFEFVVDEIVARLERVGHEVHRVAIPAAPRDRRPFGIDVPAKVWDDHPSYFTYLSQVEECRSIDLHRADLVISTHPPTFAVRHPRHLSIFFHHARAYYDLADLAVEAGIVPRAAFADARDAIRAIDADALDRVRLILAGGETVRDRLDRFNGLSSNVRLFHAGPIGAVPGPDFVSSEFAGALCVSRHEFPKRTELFVHAASMLPAIPATCVGSGGRLGFVQELASQLVATHGAWDQAPEDLWRNNVDWRPPEPRTSCGPLELVARASQAELGTLYARSLCVVAPAYGEDYGLTAIEAMSYGKPVIVCRDGGHLTHFVRDGENGFVVEPTGPAIADAIQRFGDDVDLAHKMGQAARETAAEYTWDRATAELLDGIGEVLT